MADPIPTFRRLFGRLARAVRPQDDSDSEAAVAASPLGSAPSTSRSAINSGYVAGIQTLFGRRGRHGGRYSHSADDSLYDCLELASIARGIISTHENNVSRMPLCINDPSGTIDPTHRNAPVLRLWHPFQTQREAACLAVQLYYETGRVATQLNRPYTPALPRPTIFTPQDDRRGIAPETLLILTQHQIESWHDNPGTARPWPSSYAIRDWSYNRVGQREYGLYYLVPTTEGGKTDRFPIEDLALWDHVDRFGGQDPIPPIDDVRIWLDVDARTAHWILTLVQRSYRPPLAGELSNEPDEAEQVRNYFDTELAGNPGEMLDAKKFGGINSVKFAELTPLEADWLNTRKEVAEMIARALDYPVYLLSDDRAAESNVREGRAQLLTHARALASMWGASLRPRLLTKEEIAEGYDIVPDTSAIDELAEDLDGKLATMSAAIANGYSRAQAAEMAGLPPPKGVDPHAEE